MISEVEEVLARQKSADLRNFLAPIIPILEKADTREIDMNADGRNWIEDDTGKHEASFRSTEWDRRQIVGILAGQSGRPFHALSARFEGELLEYDTRVHAIMPPLSNGTAIMLRRHAAKVYSLADYMRGGQLTVTRAIAIRQAVKRRDNICIAGAFGSGKTTAMNCVLGEKCRAFPWERIAIIQDNPECKCTHRDVLWIFARRIQERLDSQGVKAQYLYDFSDSIVDLARSNADAVVVGEVRDPSAWLGLAQAMNVGLRGVIWTKHANSAREALDRAETFTLGAGRIPNRKELARSINMIIFMKRDRFGKHAFQEVARVSPTLVDGDYALEYVA
jgi:Flp pilus assembly CpaF family ATPase